MNPCTFGVEEEFIVVDPDTLEPVAFDYAQCVADAGFKQQYISREMHQGVLETKTPICFDLQQLATRISELRELAKGCMELQGFRLMASGTHPTSHWQNVPMVDQDIYAQVVEEYQDVARSNYIFGTHMHVGFWHPSLAIPVANALREHLPLLLALSTNSPFWQGRNTGVKSFRNRIFRKMPRSGLPPVFENMQEYDDYLEWLLATGSITKPTSIWWDIRVHPIYKTVEVRVMDQQTSRQDAIGLAMFVAGLTSQIANNIWLGKIYQQHDAKKIEENMWRAARYGLDAQLINYDHQGFINARELTQEKLIDLTEVLTFQKGDGYMDYVHSLLQNNGADKQVAQFEKNSHNTLLDSLLLAKNPHRIIRTPAISTQT